MDEPLGGLCADGGIPNLALNLTHRVPLVGFDGVGQRHVGRLVYLTKDSLKQCVVVQEFSPSRRRVER